MGKEIKEYSKIKHQKWLDAKTEADKLDGELYPYILYATENKEWIYAPAPFKPYFFIRRQDYRKHREYIKRKLEKYQAELDPDYYAVSIFGEPLYKIEVPLPSFVHSKRKMKVKINGSEIKLEGQGLRPELEEKGIYTYESDIVFYYRVMLDCNIFQAPIRYKLYSDIEVEALDEFPSPSEAKHRVISISSIDEEGKEFFFSYKHETRIFKKFQELIQEEKYQVVSGWNWIEYDQKYLENRAKRKRLNNFSLFGIQKFDMMKNFKVFVQATKDLSLAEVAEQYLEEGLRKIEATPEQLWDSFQKDKKFLKKYNMNDALLVKEIDKKYDIIDQCQILTSLAPIFFQDIHKKSALWQHIVLYNLKLNEKEFDVRIVLPRRGRIKASKLKGGYVHEAPSGVYRSVMCADFTSLYPTIMMTFNLDPIAISLYTSWKKSKLSLDKWIKYVFQK